MIAAKEAAKTFVDKLLSQLQVGLGSFSTGAGVNAPLTSDRAQVKRAIDSLSANGGTSMGDGLATALDHPDKRPTDKDGKRAPAMVVLLSDGASTSGQPPAQASRAPKRPASRSTPSASVSAAPRRNRAAGPCRWTRRHCGRSPPTPAASTSTPPSPPN